MHWGIGLAGLLAMVRGPEAWVDALPAGDFRECARFGRENCLFGGFHDNNVRTQRGKRIWVLVSPDCSRCFVGPKPG